MYFPHNTIIIKYKVLGNRTVKSATRHFTYDGQAFFGFQCLTSIIRKLYLIIAHQIYYWCYRMFQTSITFCLHDRKFVWSYQWKVCVFFIKGKHQLFAVFQFLDSISLETSSIRKDNQSQRSQSSFNRKTFIVNNMKMWLWLFGCKIKASVIW